jgi:DNA-binding MarR family transcriptional regulator
MYRHRPPDDDEEIISVSVKSADLCDVAKILRQLLAQFEVLAADRIAADENHSTTKKSYSITKMELRDLAIRIIRARRARVPAFNKSMFGEPAWDMLLELYINKDIGARHSVGRLCELSGEPPTTALRWLDYLEKEKLVGREPNPTDRRTEFVEMTEKGRSAMAEYLFETLKLLM